MDAVDQAQQKEIDSLRRYVAIILVVGVIFIIFGSIFAANREIMCPHHECPHYIGNK